MKSPSTAVNRQWRLFLHDRPSYVPPQPVGEVMRAGGIGQVIDSRHPSFTPGELVLGVVGWQEYAVLDAARRATKLDPRRPPPDYMSVLAERV